MIAWCGITRTESAQCRDLLATMAAPGFIPADLRPIVHDSTQFPTGWQQVCACHVASDVLIDVTPDDI